jgi:SpoVK/Ycf46/Vps4 family AAA+-type ATPase
LAPDIDLPALASSCFGYSGADLAALVREAAMHAFSAAAAALLDKGERGAKGGRLHAVRSGVQPGD